MITGTGCECTVMSDTRVPLLLCGALVILVLLRDVCVRAVDGVCVGGSGAQGTVSGMRGRRRWRRRWGAGGAG